MDLVINEWFPEYCRPETTKENRELLLKFLEQFLQKNDVLYVRKPSAFLNKIYKFAKEFQGHRDTYSISILTFFIKTVLQNSEKCKFIDEECQLDQTVSEKLLEGNYSSDTYLFEAAVQTESRLI